ncbi:ABC transporter substrate-binding protein [Amycolatopsis orientalis]|uniref:ABC transporter substrate-binding protein n=1 Tax=Amycolatopsis orientalis TaxID=31958 RepID=UPI00055F7637|nr:extracellular solute-binding protein [Amycolatopsis orientalis]
MHRRAALAAIALLGSLALTGCDGGDQPDPAAGPIELTLWSWAPNMENALRLWNSGHPDVKVTVHKQAGGDDLIPKVITAERAGTGPDLVQAEYQMIPTLVSHDVLADIAPFVGDAKGKFAENVWSQATLGSDAVYAIPQDIAPLALFYRDDLFAHYGLRVPTTWAEFADTARDLKRKAPDRALTTFSSNNGGLFAGLAQQAGSTWWTTSGDTWKVAIDDEASRKVAGFWGDMVAEGVIDNQPMYTPAWNKALDDGTQLAWVSGVWAPGTLTTAAPATKGKWKMAPLPQWTAGAGKTGSWGGSATGVTAGAAKKGRAEAATKFVTWLNTDPTAIAALVKEAGVYPAATAAQTGGALTTPEFFPNQPEYYRLAAAIAKGTAAAGWGPNVNVAYSAFKDTFGKAAQDKSSFLSALKAVQEASVGDMRKNGFKVEG